MFEKGNTSGCSSMPSASAMNRRRASIRAHASGKRAAMSLRSASSASAIPSSMFVVKYGVPVAGMTSTWNAIPERSSIVEPAAIGELTHSSRWSWCPGLRKMPKNGSHRRRAMMSWSSPPVMPMRMAPYHSAIAAKYGATSRST